MGFLGTAASPLSDLSLVLLILAAVLIFVAWRRAAAGDGSAHHYLVLTGVALAWFFFLTYMLGRILHMVAGTAGPQFAGPPEARRLWWIPLIAVHSLSATVALVWSVVQIVSGYRHASRRRPGAWQMPPDGRVRHARGGHGFLVAWTLTTVTGVLVYLSLYVVWT